MGILSHEEILRLHAAIVSARLVESRAALLAGLHPAFVAGLPIATTLGDQHLRDLDALNAAGALADRSVPLSMWLENAVALTGIRAEGAIFKEALRQATATSPLASITPKRSAVKRYNVPELPPHFLGRPEDLARLKALVLSPTAKAIGVTGRALRAGVQGMGGIGKSVLAAWLARDADMDAAFPDGIFWISLGQTPPIKLRQAEFSAALGAPGAAFESEEQGKACLTELLSNRACLLILDDAWSFNHVTVFGETSPRGRVLITTRDASILTGLGADAHRLDVLSVAQSLKLLAEWSGQPPEALPAEARSVIKECGNLPLALAMIGAAVRGRPDRWENALHKLRTADLAAIRRSFPDYPYPDLLRAIGVSLDALDPEVRDRYLDFAVFPEDTAISEAVLQTLWRPRGLDQYGTQDALDLLQDRSLLHRDEQGRFQLHDLQRDYIVSHAGEPAALHGRLLDAYAACCKDGWSSGPDDGYFFTHLTHHLRMAGRADELRQLLLDADWLRAKLKATDAAAVLADFDALPLAEDRALASVQGALRLSAHLLQGDHREQLLQQLLGRLLDDESDEIQALSRRFAATKAGPWLRPLTASLTRPGSALQRTLTGHPDRVTAVAVTADGRWAIAGSEDKTLKVWDLHTGKELFTLTGHTDKVTAVAVSAERTIAVSGSLDGDVRVWDLSAGKELFTLTGHRAPVYAVAVTADGRRALSGSYDNTLRVWDLSRGTLLNTLLGHIFGITAVAMTPDGRRAVSSSSSGTIKVWDLDGGRELRAPTGHRLPVYALAISADGLLAVSGSEDKTLKVWQLGTGEEQFTLAGHVGPVIVVAVTPDGRLAISGSEDNTLRVWDLHKGKALRTLIGHLGSVYAVAVTADSRRAISGSHDKTLKMWDLSTGKEVHDLAGHSRRVNAVALTADGRLAVSGSSDNTLKVWELATGKELRTLVGHSQDVMAVAVSTDGRFAVSCARDAIECLYEELKVWEVDTGQELRTIFRHPNGEGTWKKFTAMAVTQDHRLAVLWSKGARLKVWALDMALETGKMLRTLTRSELNHRLVARVLPDGTLTVLAKESEYSLTRQYFKAPFALWTAKEGKLMALETGAREQLPTVTTDLGKITPMIVAPDRRLAVSGSEDGKLMVWLLGGPEEPRVLPRQLDGCMAVAAAPDGLIAVTISRTLDGRLWEEGSSRGTERRPNVTVSADLDLRLWEVSTGEELRVLTGRLDGCNAVAVTPYGLVPILTTQEGILKVWDPHTGEALRTCHRGEPSATTPDGRFVLSGAEDNTLKATDQKLGSVLATFTGESPMSVVVIASDGRTIVAGEELGGVHFLRLEGV